MCIMLKPCKKIFLFFSFFILPGFSLLAQQKIMTMDIDNVIDPRMNRYTELALDHATEIEADIVIIRMDTYGGAVNDADEIRTRILEYPKPIWVFINKNAASAGALISIACDSIYMAGGSSIGAATVVTQDGSTAPDKYQSYMRSIMRSTAEASGRDPRIAEAMVDEDIEIEGITEAGEVITFSTSEAIKYGFCEAEASSLEGVLAEASVENYTIEEFKLSGAEKIIRIFLNPVISGILILVILGGIYFELQTPGVGFPLLAAVTAAILYFVPYYLNGLAENWEIITFIVGIALLALEIFVIPGFGIAGIGGLVLTLGSLILVMLNNDVLDFSFVDSAEVFHAVAAILAGLLGSIILMFFGGVRLTNTRFFKNIALQSVQDSLEGYTSNFKEQSLLGKSGKAYTVLRPSGKVIIDNILYDASTRGDYIQKDEEILVVSEEGTSLKVRKKTEQDQS
ncbi:MAG: nodulation protein NfeD [Cyclobacteriaceae bacterium]|nr:nodulation protein NfeD [Cyclobacteriaceae bacterium]